MKVEKFIECVDQFWIDNNSIYVSKENKWIDCTNNQETLIRPEITSAREINAFGTEGVMLLFTDGRAAYSEKKREGDFTIIPNRVLSTKIIDSEKVVVYNYDNNGQNVIYNLFDLNKGKEIFSVPLTGTVISINNCLFRFDHQRFDRIDSTTGNPIWSINLATITDEAILDIVQVLAVLKHQVIVHLAPYRLISIDVDHGTVEWITGSFPKALGIESFFTWGKSYSSRTLVSWIIDAQSDKVYLLTRFFFLTMDLKTQDWKIQKNYHGDKQTPWDFSYAKEYNGKLFFIGAIRNSMPNRLGIFDIGKNDVLWSHEFKSILNRDVKVSKTYLAVKDANRVLYIFGNE